MQSPKSVQLSWPAELNSVALATSIRFESIQINSIQLPRSVQFNNAFVVSEYCIYDLHGEVDIFSKSYATLSDSSMQLNSIKFKSICQLSLARSLNIFQFNALLC